MKKPSLNINILAGLISQIYLIIANILVVPIYIKYLGAESYGLVAFFVVLQGVFLLLDMGLTPTLSRQATLFHSGALNALHFIQIFRFVRLFFYLLGFLALAILFLLSEKIVYQWINIEVLDLEMVHQCFYMMIVCVFLRWIVGLYRGILTGFECVAWLSVINIIMATLKFLGVLLYMYFLGFNVFNFFIFQLVVGILEYLIFYIKTRQLLPKNHEYIPLNFSVIKPLLPFVLSIGFSSFVWIVVTQLDKVILSGILTLSEYAYFNVAVLVAGAIIQVNAPISNAIMPRMAFLYSENNVEKMRQVYLNATQIVTVLIVTTGLFLVFFAEPILYVWSNDSTISKKSSEILQLYALGNVFLVLSAFPYYLQYAKGDMKYHLWGNILSLSILLPAIIYAAYQYGVVGAGIVWLVTHLLFLCFWVSFVHKKIEPNINMAWFKSFLPSVISVCAFLYLANVCFSINLYENRILALFELIIFFVMTLCIAMFGSKFFRDLINSKLRV